MSRSLSAIEGPTLKHPLVIGLKQHPLYPKDQIVELADRQTIEALRLLFTMQTKYRNI